MSKAGFIVHGVRTPTVVLYSYTKNPLKCFHIAWSNMHSLFLPSAKDNDYVSQLGSFEEIIKHQHKTALEYCNFVFGMSEVTRAFQQQITRHRVGISFSIQSLRQVDLTKKFTFRYPPGLTQDQEGEYLSTMMQIHNKYCKMLDDGIPIEDARSILPLNTCSNITMAINYRAVFEMANQRLCSTTQAEFQEVMLEMKARIMEVEPVLGQALRARCEYTQKCNQGRWSCGKYPCV